MVRTSIDLWISYRRIKTVARIDSKFNWDVSEIVRCIVKSYDIESFSPRENANLDKLAAIDVPELLNGWFLVQIEYTEFLNCERPAR